MSEERIKKLNELIKRELGGIILKEFDLPADVLVTISRTHVSPNLSQVKVYVSIIPESRGAAILSILNKNIYSIQQFLNKRLRMRIVPKIIFQEEKKEQEADRVDKLLNEIKKEEDS